MKSRASSPDASREWRILCLTCSHSTSIDSRWYSSAMAKVCWWRRTRAKEHIETPPSLTLLLIDKPKNETENSNYINQPGQSSRANSVLHIILTGFLFRYKGIQKVGVCGVKTTLTYPQLVKEGNYVTSMAWQHRNISRLKISRLPSLT